MCFVGFCMGIWRAQVTVGGFKGKGFAGQLTSRVWYLKVHSASEPFAVVLTNSSGQAVELPKYVLADQPPTKSPTKHYARTAWILNYVCHPEAEWAVPVRPQGLAAAAAARTTGRTTMYHYVVPV